MHHGTAHWGTVLVQPQARASTNHCVCCALTLIGATQMWKRKFATTKAPSLRKIGIKTFTKLVADEFLFPSDEIGLKRTFHALQAVAGGDGRITVELAMFGLIQVQGPCTAKDMALYACCACISSPTCTHCSIPSLPHCR